MSEVSKKVCHALLTKLGALFGCEVFSLERRVGYWRWGDSSI